MCVCMSIILYVYVCCMCVVCVLYVCCMCMCMCIFVLCVFVLCSRVFCVCVHVSIVVSSLRAQRRKMRHVTSSRVPARSYGALCSRCGHALICVCACAYIHIYMYKYMCIVPAAGRFGTL